MFGGQVLRVSKIFLRKVDFWNEADAVWQIFKDSAHMFSDLTLKMCGHDAITDKYKLYDLFYKTILVFRHKPIIGVYNERSKLIAISYVTNVFPMYPLPLQENYDTEDEWLAAHQWEGSYHGSMHPSYRTPKYSRLAITETVDYFRIRHEIDFLFSFLRADNRPANLALLRNGFEHIDLMRGYREHAGEPKDYNLYLYRGR